MSGRFQSILLIGFTVLFLFIILGWGTFKNIFGLSNKTYSAARVQYDRLKGINIGYRLILIGFTIISVIYFYYPTNHIWIRPIHWLDNAYVNTIGFIILLIAFFLVIRSQIKLDKNLHLYYSDPSKTSNSRLVPDTEKNLLKSILLVYIGLFTVVSTYTTLLLVIASVVIYYLRSTNRQYKIPTSIEH